MNENPSTSSISEYTSRSHDRGCGGSGYGRSDHSREIDQSASRNYNITSQHYKLYGKDSHIEQYGYQKKE